MEEVQSWWEVPSITHFCYAFRSAFNLFFFEIAELESALLNVQDPDMSISLEQLIIKLLQGCYDEESVNYGNWEEKLCELFNENLEVDENPFSSSAYFFQLTPRSKIEVLLKLCELRLDVEDVLDSIKNIPSEDMQAKFLGKDNQNYKYWYFCDERLYKEDTSTGNKAKELKNKNAKKTPIKKQTSTRERRNKTSLDIDKSWMVACFNLSDWEKLMQQLSKSKNSNEKELLSTIKNHFPLIQERAAEKDRLLRKRYLELAPKRTSSRISEVQEKKKNKELQAAEEARIAKIEAEKERARKEYLMLKEQKESRKRRIEERHKAIEERAERVKLRELARYDSDSDDDDDDNDEDDDDDEQPIKRQKVMPSRTQRNQQNTKWQDRESEDENDEKSSKSQKFMPSRTQRNRRNIKWRYQESESEDEGDEQPRKIQKVLPFRTQRNRRNIKWRYQESESEDEEIDDNVSEDQFPNNSYQRSSRRTVTTKLDAEITDPNCSPSIRTYSNTKHQSRIGEPRTSSRLQSNTKSLKYQCDLNKTGQEIDPISTMNCKKTSPMLQCTEQNFSEKSDSEESDNESSCGVTNTCNKSIKISIKNSGGSYSICKEDSKLALPNNYSNRSQNFSPTVNVYKTVLQNTSDVSKWNSTLDSKRQKLHILHSTHSNLTSKKSKLEHFKTVSPNAKSLSKENQIYKPVQKSSFITFGKVVPTPSIVKLEYRKPPNPQVSS